MCQPQYKKLWDLCLQMNEQGILYAVGVEFYAQASCWRVACLWAVTRLIFCISSIIFSL